MHAHAAWNLISRNEPIKNARVSISQQVTNCYQHNKSQSMCPICYTLIDIQEENNHGIACHRNHAEKHQGSIATINNYSKINGNRLCKWQLATFYLCPFATCVDDDMRQSGFHHEVEYLRPISVKRNKTKSYYRRAPIPIYNDRSVFKNHLAEHLFTVAQDNNGKIIKSQRVATKDGRLVCGIYKCQLTFPNSIAARDERICHLRNDHQIDIAE